MAANPLNAFAADATRTSAIDGISITPDNQILVELMPEDTASANLFDLNGRTLVFTPNGQGGYSRQVQALAWEEEIGEAVADGVEIQIVSFRFDFAGRRWGSFHVSRTGVLTFGGPFTHDGGRYRFLTMNAIADQFVTLPTIGALYKPYWDARLHVGRRADQVVVTWIATEPEFYVNGIPPARPAHFQAILGADGSVRFSYRDVTLGDGIVGLFPNEELSRATLIASIADPRNPELPGHLDLLEVAIYETNTDALILEFILRDSVPDPPAGEKYSYRIHFDMDEPFWSHPVAWSDEDFAWGVDVRPGGERTAWAWQRGSMQLLPSNAGNKIAVLADMGGINSGTSISVAAFGETVRYRGDTFVEGQGNETGLANFDLIAERAQVDLSRPDSKFSSRHREVFHYGRVRDRDMAGITCGIIDSLGNEFDLLVFHSEFRTDYQVSGVNWVRYDDEIQGIGYKYGRTLPCGEGRLKGHWAAPVWMKAVYKDPRYHYRNERHVFDRHLGLFAHEFTHHWAAFVSYDRDGQRRTSIWKVVQLSLA